MKKAAIKKRLMKPSRKALTVAAVNALMRGSQERLRAMVGLLTAVPGTVADEEPSTHTIAPLHCIAILPIVSTSHVALNGRLPARAGIYSWLALTESSTRQVISIHLHRDRKRNKWVFASIMLGGTAKKLRGVVRAAASAREAKPWLVSINNMRFLGAIRSAKGLPAAAQVIQKGLTSLKEGTRYSLTTLQSRLAQDELQHARKRQVVLSMQLPSSGRPPRSAVKTKRSTGTRK